MKKIFTLVALAFASVGAFAQTHCEWTAAQIPQDVEAAEAAGFTNMYDGAYFATTANYTLCEGGGFKALFEKTTLIGKPNSKYPGYTQYKYVPLMGMNNSTRDGIDPIHFFEGLENNQYVRTNKFSDEVSYTDAIVTMTVAPAAEGGKFGMVTLTYSKGDNLSVMYVVDVTAKNGEGMMVLQSRTRNEGADVIQSHVAKFGVEPGHTYYVMSSEKQSVELYGLSFDDINSDKYETLMSATDYPVYWNASQIPQDVEAAEAAGFTNMYDGAYFATTANYTLCEGEGFKASFEKTTLIGKPNSKYPGYTQYKYVPLMGMNNSTRDGIDPIHFFEGLENNQYVRTNKFSDEVSYTDAIVTMTVAPAAEGGKFGKVTLNYSKGDNLSVMYVVDVTAKNGEGMMVLQSRTRNEGATNIYTHTAQFGVEPGHTYYVMSSEKQSVELYGLGYCPVTADKYNTTTGIENIAITPNKAQDDAIYTLQGVRVSKPVKGINIINGKKVVVK